MKKIFMAAIASLIALISFSTDSASQNKCDQMNDFKNIKMRILYSKVSGCYLSVDQNDSLRLSRKNRNRSYSFFPDGKIMVFIGTDDYERMSQATGARMFHMLPFKNGTAPSYSAPEGDQVISILPSGHPAVFSAETGDAVSIEGFKVALQPIEHFDKMVKIGGGFDIKPENGNIVIDYGWRTGEMSITQLYRTSMIIDADGNKCQVKNSELFMKDTKDPDEVLFKIKNNAELDKFLRKRCPAVKMIVK